MVGGFGPAGKRALLSEAHDRRLLTKRPRLVAGDCAIAKCHNRSVLTPPPCPSFFNCLQVSQPRDGSMGMAVYALPFNLGRTLLSSVRLAVRLPT